MQTAQNVQSGSLDRRLSVAPMMERTDRHERYFLRLITRRALLYTEMITTGAILHGDRARLLAFDEAEHPLALQLGGSAPDDLARAAEIGQSSGYDEINLNVGCPSDRVRSGRFGACLMAEPDLVAACVRAMGAAVDLPVTVKCRIGIAGREAYADLKGFVEAAAAAGAESFALHARIAVLEGLSPAENREIPPLRYDRVYRLKADYPGLEIVINGGVGSLDEAQAHLGHVDGVMIGRAAYRTPYVLSETDARIFGEARPTPSRHEVVRAFLPYVERRLAQDTRLHSMSRHILGLFQGRAGARAWRRYLSEHAHRPGAGPEVIEQALALVPEDAALTAAEA